MNPNATLLHALILTLGVGAASSAHANERNSPRFERTRWPSRGERVELHRPADRNRDGFVARRELLAKRRREALADARRIDLNRDGWLSPFELRRAGRFNAGYSPRDLDRDGRVSRPEARAVARGRRTGISVTRFIEAELAEAQRDFDRLDRNDDGRIGPRERRIARVDPARPPIGRR